MKILLLIAFLFISCTPNDDEEDFCIVTFAHRPWGPVEFYSTAETGLSCSEFNKRQNYAFQTSCKGKGVLYNGEVDDATADTESMAKSNDEVYNNNPITGVDKGAKIAFDDHYIYSLQTNFLKIEDKESFKLIKNIKIENSPYKIYVYNNYLILVSTKLIEVRNKTDYSVTAQFEFSSVHDTQLRGNQLFISDYYFNNELKDESFCERIQYLNNDQNRYLMTNYDLDLKDLSLIESGSFYGASHKHIDENKEYIVYGNGPFSRQSALYDETQKKIHVLEGSILYNRNIKTYAETLHLFSRNDMGEINYHILDQDLNETYVIKDISPDHTIGAIRFGKQFSYLMTYISEDPLFIFDLTNPNEPVLLSEYHFPGTPLFVQELNQNKLVSFGTENQKLIISLFDITNKENPELVDQVSLFNFDWFEYIQVNDILFYKDYLLVKRFEKFYLIHITDNSFDFVDEYEVGPDARVYFSKNKLYIKRYSSWEKVNLND